MYKYIKIVKEEFKFILTLSRAEKRNAFTPTMINEIAHAFEIANADDTIKIVIIKAEGPVFCAGMDLNTFKNPELDVVNPAIQNKDISLGEVFQKLLKPSIAIVEGNVIAGGFMIILGCTYVFCLPEVKFRLPELALGIFPFQVMASLLKVMPEKQMLQLCLDTGYFDVDKAIRLGIVDNLFSQESVDRLIHSFHDKDSKVLKAGMKAVSELSPSNFDALKTKLNALK